MNLNLFYSTFLLIFVAGCAGVTVSPITSENQKGIRFYQPQPYLLVTQDKFGNSQSKIIWLPNPTKEFVITSHGWIGSDSSKFTLESGWNLIQYGEIKDSKIPETLGALLGIAREATKIPFTNKQLRQGPTAPVLTPGLYKIDFDTKTGLVSDIQLVPIK